MLEAEITDEDQFCLWSFEANPLVSLAVCERARIGFLCGQTGEPEVYEPRAWYPDAALYGAEQLVSGESRPWGGVNAWIAAPEDAEPWAELRWDAPVAAREVRLYHRAAAGTSLIAAFQKAGAAYCMVNTRPRALSHILRRLGIFSKIMYMCPQFCGICKPKRFPVFPRKRSDLLQMLLSRLLMPPANFQILRSTPSLPPPLPASSILLYQVYAPRPTHTVFWNTERSPFFDTVREAEAAL